MASTIFKKNGRRGSVTVTLGRKDIVGEYAEYLTDAESAAAGVLGFGKDLMAAFSSSQRVRPDERATAYSLIRYSVELGIYRSSIACIRAA